MPRAVQFQLGRSVNSAQRAEKFFCVLRAPIGRRQPIHFLFIDHGRRCDDEFRLALGEGVSGLWSLHEPEFFQLRTAEFTDEQRAVEPHAGIERERDTSPAGNPAPNVVPADRRGRPRSRPNRGGSPTTALSAGDGRYLAKTVSARRDRRAAGFCRCRGSAGPTPRRSAHERLARVAGGRCVAFRARCLRAGSTARCSSVNSAVRQLKKILAHAQTKAPTPLRRARGRKPSSSQRLP